MVKPPANFTEVDGRILEVRPAQDRSGWIEVVLDFKARSSVEGYKDMLRQQPGEPLVILVKDSLVTEACLAPGQPLLVQVRRGLDRERVFLRPESLPR